jgi:hypothetical protein
VQLFALFHGAEAVSQFAVISQAAVVVSRSLHDFASACHSSTATAHCTPCLSACLSFACLLAVQIEEHYISAAELGRLTGAPAEVILRTELTALQVAPRVLASSVGRGV